MIWKRSITYISYIPLFLSDLDLARVDTRNPSPLLVFGETPLETWTVIHVRVIKSASTLTFADFSFLLLQWNKLLVLSKSGVSLPPSPSFNFTLSWRRNLSLIASSTRAVQLRECRLSMHSIWLTSCFSFSPPRSPRTYKWNGFNLPYISVVAFQHISCNVHTIYWDNLRIFISPCRLHTPLGFGKMSSWDFQRTLFLEAHHWPCVSLCICFPEYLNDTTIYAVFFAIESPASFCYVIGIQLS